MLYWVRDDDLAGWLGEFNIRPESRTARKRLVSRLRGARKRVAMAPQALDDPDNDEPLDFQPLRED